MAIIDGFDICVLVDGNDKCGQCNVVGTESTYTCWLNLVCHNTWPHFRARPRTCPSKPFRHVSNVMLLPHISKPQTGLSVCFSAFFLLQSFSPHPSFFRESFKAIMICMISQKIRLLKAIGKGH